MEDTVYGLPLAAIAKIQGVFANWPQVEKAVLYGSRAKGLYKSGSDIDLTLFGAGLDLPLLFKIENELDDLLLPWMIDLSLFAQIDHAALREHIDRVGIVFYKRSTPLRGRIFNE